MALAAALVGSVAAGCGTADDPDLANGKQLFVERCASCHALARADAKGVTGPDLDEAFGPSRRQGLGQTTVEAVVLGQISNVLRNSQMPADLVTGEDAEDVAAYVARVAGQPGEDEGRLASAGKTEVSSKPIAAADGQLQIDADPTGALAFESSKAIASPGPLELLSVNESATPHNIAIRDGGKLIEGDVVSGGGTSKLTANLEPGKYEFVCTVPGHEDGGMKGVLTVR
jgi:mono/diheme cytochrome c family protein